MKNIKQYFKDHPFFSNQQKRNCLIFWIFIALLIIFIILGITLSVLGSNDYHAFVGEWKYYYANTTIAVPLPKPTKDISLFIYGIFFVVLAILFALTNLIYGNSIFNKKLNSLK